MGGSSGGGGGGFSSGATWAEKGALKQQSDAINAQAGYGGQIGAMAGSQDVMNLAGAGMTPAEQQQLRSVGLGRDYAMQTTQQNVREQAASRGLFSSGSAIANEAAALGQFDIQQAQQVSNIYGQAQQRQFQGLGLRSGLLGQAGGIYGQAAAGYGQVAGGYQNRQQVNNQAQGMQNQYQQQQQQQQYGMIQGAGQLGLGVISAFSDRRLKYNIRKI